MTYLQFHAAFTLPWLAVLGWWTLRAGSGGRRIAGPGFGTNRTARLALVAHAVAALVYTTPWDNHLVALGVWGYPEGRVWFTVGHVPFEEYLFFVVQALTTGMVLLAVSRRVGRLVPTPVPSPPARGRAVRLAGALVACAAAGSGAIALGTDAGRYLGLILVWGMPVLALQWAFGGDLILARWRVVLPSVALPTLWLWLADRVAIGAGTWWIGDAFTTGVALLGLPLEEAVFFLVTSLMVAFGMTLVLHPASWRRWERLRGRMRPRAGAAWKLALAAWAASMVAVPLAPGAFEVLAYVSTGLLALGTLSLAVSAIGPKAWALFAISVAFGLGVEALGSRTGVPFGRYAYDAPGPAVLGVPVLVPLGWWAFTAVAIAAAPPRRVVIVAPAVLVAWDLGLDPLMVHHGFWRFETAGPYAGVPLVNFAGWYVAGLVLVALLTRLAPDLQRSLERPLRIVFVAQTFFLVFGLAYFGLAWPAVVTAVAMGSVAAGWLGSGRGAAAERGAG